MRSKLPPSEMKSPYLYLPPFPFIDYNNNGKNRIYNTQKYVFQISILVLPKNVLRNINIFYKICSWCARIKVIFVK